MLIFTKEDYFKNVRSIIIMIKQQQQQQQQQQQHGV